MTENLAVSSPGKPPLSMPVIRQILFERLDHPTEPVAERLLLGELSTPFPNRFLRPIAQSLASIFTAFTKS